MDNIDCLQAFAQTFGLDRLPLRTPVLVFGKPAMVTGRSFAGDGLERYDVLWPGGQVQHSLPRSLLAVDFDTLRKKPDDNQ